jgi:tetratricopeptide (TPR) repeat protein
MSEKFNSNGNKQSHNGHGNGRHNDQSIRKRRQVEPEFFKLLRRGTRALQRGNVAEATRLLEQAYELNNTHGDLILNLGGAYVLSKQFKKAVEILEPLSEREPDNPMVWTNLGAAYLGNPVLATNEKQQRAIGAFKLAIALSPKAPNVAYNLGLIYRDRQEVEQALYWFQRALEANPDDRDAQYYIRKLSQDADNQESRQKGEQN